MWFCYGEEMEKKLIFHHVVLSERATEARVELFAYYWVLF